MTTAKELRAMAEEIANADSFTCDRDDGLCEVDRFVWAKAQEQARHILSTVHADDDEPVTDVWWRTLNRAWFASTDDGEEHLCLVVHDDAEEDPDERCLIVLCDDGSWGFWEQDRKSNELHNPHHNTFQKLHTRGDVRRLCAALGIPLEETKTT